MNNEKTCKHKDITARGILIFKKSPQIGGPFKLEDLVVGINLSSESTLLP